MTDYKTATESLRAMTELAELHTQASLADSNLGELGKARAQLAIDPLEGERGTAELARAVYPDVVGGLYEPQEMEDA